MRTSEARGEFDREVEAARAKFEQEVEAVRRALGKKLEAARTRALDKMGHLAFVKKADMRKAHALLHELEQHLLKQNVRT
jgi:F0F1-type ATP synthase membrane subunit b/b'